MDTQYVRKIDKKKGIDNMMIYERTEIAKAVNFGKYPVLTYDLDTRKGSTARVMSNSGDYYHNCVLHNGMEKKDDGIMYLSTNPAVMRAEINVYDYLEMAEYANSPIIEPNQEVAILMYSKRLDVAMIMMVKSGRVDGSFSVATKFSDIEGA